LNKDKERHLKEFKVDTITLSYPRDYYIAIKECLVFDVYRTDLLKEGDAVMDLGATVGEFTIPASKKVGDSGLVIAVEPNPEDFELLIENLNRNKCRNVIAVNKGVASEVTEREITFMGKSFKAQLDTLENIVHNIRLNRDINFLKMDIEGYEIDVISTHSNIIKNADIISIELHGSKNEIDRILEKYGFNFKPVTAGYCIKKLLKSSLSPARRHLVGAIFDTISRNPRLLYKLLLGYKMGERKDESTKTNLTIGAYMRGDQRGN